MNEAPVGTSSRLKVRRCKENHSNYNSLLPFNINFPGILFSSHPNPKHQKLQMEGLGCFLTAYSANYILFQKTCKTADQNSCQYSLVWVMNLGSAQPFGKWGEGEFYLE